MDLNRRRAAQRQMTCPTCGRRFPPESARSMPFCSVRCQQIDLGRWFNEEIGLPVEPHEADWEVDEGFTN